MRSTATFHVRPSAEAVSTHLANPRNFFVASSRGEVVEQSDPPVRTGSWAILAFDQIRARVDYTAYEPGVFVAVSVTYSGRGSFGLNGTYAYRHGPSLELGGTTVTMDAESSGWLPPLVRTLIWTLTWRRARTRMDAARSDVNGQRG